MIPNLLQSIYFNIRIITMSQQQRRTPQQLFQEAKNNHIANQTGSTIIENKVQYMEKIIEEHSKFLSCGLCSSGKVKVDQGFKRAFKTLTFQQQVMLYWRTCEYIKQIKTKKGEQKKADNPENILRQSLASSKDLLDTTIYVKDKKEYKKWTVTRITGSCASRKLIITDTSTTIDMHDYLIRSSKSKEKTCFALQCTRTQQSLQTLRISNEGLSYQKTLSYFKRMFKLALRDQLKQIIDPSHHESIGQIQMPKKVMEKKLSIKDRSLPSSNNIADKMITLKIITPAFASQPQAQILREMLQKQKMLRFRDDSYNHIYKYLVPAKILSQIDDTKDFDKVQQGQLSIVYEMKKQNKVKKKYRFKKSEIVILDFLVDQMNNLGNYKKWKKNLVSIKVLRVFPSEKSKLIHEVFKQGGKNYNYVYVRHHFSLSSNNSQSKCFFFYDQSVNPALVKKFFGILDPIVELKYVIWKFQQIQDNFILTCEGKADHFQNEELNTKFLNDYIGSFHLLKSDLNTSQYQSDIFVNTILFEDQYLQQISELLSEQDEESEYYTVTDSYNQNKPSLKDQSPIPPNILPETMMKKRVSFQEGKLINTEDVLKFRHPVVPYKKGPPFIQNPIHGDHPQWENEWIINSKGDLINVNKEKIAAQNNVMRSVLKRLGRNILAGKSLLNISLPVDVFGDDSNLSRLCHSYGYAPIFLEQAMKALDPIQRFKKVVAFAVTATVLYLRMDKPFNPILGETYQSLVDGCPIYGQQISHHPPISAVFLKGRGYTLHGNVQAKVQLSMNSASGSNQGEISVSFDPNDISKKIVKYTTPAGQLSGVMYGDRKMSMIKKSYFYDPQNGLYCEMNWGKHKGSKSQFAKNFNDSLEGQLVRLKPGFNEKNWKSVKKQDIQQNLGLFNGRWTGAAFYDSEPLFDTYKVFPHIIQKYGATLQSDASKRKDLILRRDATHMEPAQQAKEELEELQRKDRKLRQQYAKQK